MRDPFSADERVGALWFRKVLSGTKVESSAAAE